MKLALEVLGALLILAWFIDYLTFLRERKMAKQARRPWWNEREDGPEGDH